MTIYPAGLRPAWPSVATDSSGPVWSCWTTPITRCLLGCFELDQPCLQGQSERGLIEVVQQENYNRAASLVGQE